MSLIHTCELNGANPFDYLTEVQKQADQLAKPPAASLPNGNLKRRRGYCGRAGSAILCRSPRPTPSQYGLHSRSLAASRLGSRPRS